MNDWRWTAKLIGATFLVTSAGWMIAGAILFESYRQDALSKLAEARIEPARTARRVAVVPEPHATASVGRLLIPVVGVARGELVDTFTQARAGGARVHDAIDIMAPLGTPVVAAAAGTVEKLFVSKPGGNTVYIRSPDRRLLYYYAHLDRYAPGLAERQRVSAGTPLGTVGYTGNANPEGPHLHFAILSTTPEAKWSTKAPALNPYPLLMRR